MSGRPRKNSNPKKVELSPEQKRYAVMVKEIEVDLEKRKERLAVVDEKISKLKEESTSLNSEIKNLEGAKRNMENVLNELPAPPEWEQFVRYVYEYHYHYYPTYPPVTIGPWWTYTVNGGLTYPSWTTVTNASGAYISSGNISTINLNNNASLSALNGNTCFLTTSGAAPTITNSNVSDTNPPTAAISFLTTVGCIQS